MKRIITFFILVLSCSYLFSATNKVYLSVPNETIDTEKIIQQLLSIEEIPIMQKEKAINELKIENSVINDFSSYVRNLDEISKAMYDYQSPFGDMLGVSSDENILEVSASRRAVKDNYNIKVEQTAKADSFKSDSIPRDQELPKSKFDIKLGENKASIDFPGGTVYTLANSIKAAVDEYIDVKTINDSKTTVILSITGRSTGEENKIYFGGELDTLIDIGLLAQGGTEIKSYKVTYDGLAASGAKNIEATKTNAILKSAAYGSINLSSMKLKIDETSQFVINVDLIQSAIEDTGPSIDTSMYREYEAKLIEPLDIGGISIEAPSLKTFYNDAYDKYQSIKPQSEFTRYITLYLSDGMKKFINVTSGGIFTNALKLYKGRTVSRIALQNDNTDKELLISEMVFLSEDSFTELRPKNQISEACDAKMMLNGVEIASEDNSIDDVVEGVTFNLIDENDKTVHVTVDYDQDKILSSINQWVESYNNCMLYLSTLVTPSTNNLSLTERDAASVKDGLFQAESTLKNVQNRLRTITMAAYDTGYGRDLNMLEQIGIYVRKSGTFTLGNTGTIDNNTDDWKATQMGLLQVDSGLLKSSIKDKIDGIAKLFANDTDGDLTRESGVCVEINSALKLLLGSGGFLQRRVSANDNQVVTINKEIVKLQDNLSSYETKIRSQYGSMNQAMRQAESQKTWMNAQFNNNK